MVNFLQGPGQNTNYYLITTGINSDPNHGSMGFENYNQIKSVIQERAEIIFENDIVRKFTGLTVGEQLKAYDNTPRIVYQVLIGTARYSDPWKCEELQAAIGEFPRNPKTLPNDGEYSIDFVASLENGMKINQAVLTPSLEWIQNDDFFYSSVLPSIGIGAAGDVWFVGINNQFELFHRPAFAWATIFEFINMVVPVGKLFISTIEPTPQTNSWWLDPTGIVIRKFSSTINNWEAPSPITVSDIEPSTPNVDDLWLMPIFGKMKLFKFDGARFVPAPISKHPVRDKASDSLYVGDLTKNNYLVECNDSALLGGILSTIGESLMIEGQEGYDDVVALGGANETFVGFFTNTPVSDLSITVYFNGLALRAGSTAGWTRSGTTLVLVDAVNGFASEAGDIISATYRF